MAEWLVRGLGWAWLPRHVVQYPAYQGLMVELDSEWTPPALVVELVWRRDELPGPAACCWRNVLPSTCRRSARKADKPAAMNRTLYRAVLSGAKQLVAIRLWLRARKAPAYAKKRIGERFSLALPVMKPGGIWVHASVGESYRGGADDPRLAATLSTAADYRDLHDPDRVRAHPGVVCQ